VSIRKYWKNRSLCSELPTASINPEPLPKPNTNVLTLFENNGMNISSMQDFGLFVSLRWPIDRLPGGSQEFRREEGAAGHRFMEEKT